MYVYNIPYWIEAFLRNSRPVRFLGDIDPEPVKHTLLFSMIDSFSYTSLGLLDILKMLYSEHRISKVIFLSTYGIYGDKLNRLPVSETEQTHPSDQYSTIAHSVEEVLDYLSQKYEVPTYVLRLFTVYSPFQPISYIVPWIVNSIMHDKVLMIGDIEKVRDYIYVSDVANLIHIIANSEENDVFNIVNVGTGKPTSVGELIEITEFIVGKKAQVVFDATRIREEFDPDYAVSDISKAKKMFDWEPKVDLEQGITYMYHWLMGRGSVNV